MKPYSFDELMDYRAEVKEKYADYIRKNQLIINADFSKCDVIWYKRLANLKDVICKS